MMKKVAVVTDSTCCLPQEIVKEYDINVVPLYIVYEGKSYRDGVDITAQEVYRIMRRREDLPTTATAAVGDFLEVFHNLAEKAESILCITLTSILSKTFEAATAAKSIAREQFPRTVIEVFDSRAVGGALGFMVTEAAKVAKAGGTLAAAQEAAKKLMGKVKLYAMLDTLYYLARLGRIGKAAAWAGALLDMKPILQHSPAHDEAMPVARPRTKQKAIEQLLQILKRDIGGLRVHINIHHADEMEEAKRLVERVGKEVDCAEVYITEFTPLMGVHTGPGVLGFSFYAD
jgi:DegV family protein with EDD domain